MSAEPALGRAGLGSGGPASASGVAAPTSNISAGLMALTVGGPVIGAIIIFFAVWMVWKRVDLHSWRGHPIPQPVTRKAVVLIAEPKCVKIPVVIVQPDRALDVGYPFAPRHARSASAGSTGSEGSLDYRVLTVVDTAQCGPLWSAPVAALSEGGDTPRSRRPGGSSFGSPAELAQLQEQAQAQLLAQAAANAEAHEEAAAAAAAAAAGAQQPIGFSVAAPPSSSRRTISPGTPRASGSGAGSGSSKAPARHARCRSLDVASFSRRLEKERGLTVWQLQQQAGGDCCPAASSAAASGAAPSPSDASPPTPPQLASRSQHRRSRSATVTPLCR